MRFLMAYLLAAAGGFVTWSVIRLSYALPHGDLGALAADLPAQAWWISAATIVLGCPAHLFLEFFGRQGWLGYSLAGVALGSAATIIVFGEAGLGFAPVTGMVGLVAATTFWTSYVRDAADGSGSRGP